MMGNLEGENVGLTRVFVGVAGAVPVACSEREIG